MSQARRVAKFPWAALDSVERGPEAVLRAARRALGDALRPDAFGDALSRLVDTSVEVVVRSIDSRRPPGHTLRLAFGAAGKTGSSVVCLEPALAGALLAALLRRPVPMLRPEAALDETLLGALSALFVEAARRSGMTSALFPIPIATTQGTAIVHLSVIVGGKPYVAALEVASSFDLPTAPPASAQLAGLRDLELALPLVVSVSLATPSLLSSLCLGAAYVPSPALTVDRLGRGTGTLVSGTSECGVSVELRSNGEIVLGEPVWVALAATEAMEMDKSEAEAPRTIEAAVLDAPLVVRIELGQVSMPAREWALLEPGDVIETGRRIAGPVGLRAGGRLLATGELVDIEGELGVRVLEIVEAGPSGSSSG